MNSDLPESAPAPAPEAADAPVAAPATDVAAELKALFPALFTGKPKPVKLRIQADIQERAPGRFTKAQLSAFLRRHTGGTGYLIALTQAKTRFDLDGNPAGEIAEEHLAAAREELARRKGVQQERQQLEVQQRRNRAQLLWDFERTTLTETNFCALKGLTVEELPGILEIARKERAEAPPAPPREARRDGPPRRDERRPGGGGRPEGRSEGRREGGRPPQRQGRKPEPPRRDQAAAKPQAPQVQETREAQAAEPPKDQAAE
ncbi:MAG: prop effector ProQ [Comamonadaceae bacterium]|nr:prop effector ProQ [Comamonadaceae bacterium]